jgi:hypothetical protein
MSLAAGVQVTALAQRDQFLYVGTRGLGLGDSGHDTVFQQDGRHQVAQQGAAVAGVASEFVSSIAMAHGKISRLRAAVGRGISAGESHLSPAEMLGGK